MDVLCLGPLLALLIYVGSIIYVVVVFLSNKKDRPA